MSFMFVVMAVLSFSTLVNNAVAQTVEFKPYAAVLISDGAKIFAGPSDVYYATEELSSGEEVHVYAHDAGGWCAIRPTPNSFSMVLAGDIELLSDSVAQIANDGAKAWVGTTLTETDQPLWQVRLKKGEKLRLLGVVKEQYELEEGQPDWIQVAPPRGEFRWIHQSNIKRTSAIVEVPGTSVVKSQGQSERTIPTPIKEDSVLGQLQLGSQNEQQENDPTASSFSSSSKRPTPANEFDIVEGTRPFESSNQSQNQLSNSLSGPSIANRMGDTTNTSQTIRQIPNDGTSGWRPASKPIREIMPEIVDRRTPDADVGLSYNSNGSIKVSSYENYDNSNNEPSAFSTAAYSQTNSEPKLLPALDPNSDYSANIQRLELELTQQASKDPQDWNLQPLIAECQFCLQNSTDAAERQQAERLLTKTMQFQRVQNGYATGGQVWPDSNLRVAAQGASQNSGQQVNPDGQNQPAAGAQKLAGNYDAVGVLNKLVRDNGRTRPTYVLEDENGKIIHHIAPAPGVNLHRYLKKNIAVIGQRGFHQQLKLSHITAERVVEVQPIRR